MPEIIRSLRGTRDILPPDSSRWQYVERIAHEVATSYGFEEIRLPIIERTELFIRSVGDSTDVVQKEMYSFTLGDESITLRPEGTAGVVRSMLQNGTLGASLPARVYYTGPFFRHENPQAGRYRQFTQFGVECFGPEAPTQDAEVILLAQTFLARLGIGDLRLHINSIGCAACRPAYNQLLRDYYRPLLPQLCEDCQGRFERNPLRLLDCKKQGCQPFRANAPRGIDHLCEACETHFNGVKASLEQAGTTFTIDPDIVRGLDYYNRTVFEFISDSIGSQATVCGGGRYDGLVQEMGGPPTPALGFGIGLDRLLLTMEALNAPFPAPPKRDIYIGSMGSEENQLALRLATALRAEGFGADFDTMGRSVRAQMKHADRLGVRYSCIIGGNELAENAVGIRNMSTGESTSTALTPPEFVQFLYDQAGEAILDAGTTL